MKGSKLKEFKLVNAEGIGSLRTLQGVIDLKEITDEQAAKLYAAKSRYIEKVEAEAPKPAKK